MSYLGSDYNLNRDIDEYMGDVVKKRPITEDDVEDYRRQELEEDDDLWDDPDSELDEDDEDYEEDDDEELGWDEDELEEDLEDVDD